MLTNKEYQRMKKQNQNNLIKNLIFATTFTFLTATIMKRCEANAVEEESKIETIINEEPYCLHKGTLQYQSIDRVGTYTKYCASSESRCPYYHLDKNKEYCNAEQKVKKKGF